jgi:hypothetical protein
MSCIPAGFTLEAGALTGATGSRATGAAIEGAGTAGATPGPEGTTDNSGAGSRLERLEKLLALILELELELEVLFAGLPRPLRGWEGAEVALA